MVRASTPEPEIRGAVTWTMTRETRDLARSSRHETLTTRLTMDLVLRVAKAGGGVSLYQGAGGAWTAEGAGSIEEYEAGCTVTRRKTIGLRGAFGSGGNAVTLLHNQSKGTGLLNFSVNRGAGAALATTYYCDGSTVSQDTTYFWGISDVDLDVRLETGADGRPRYIVAKQLTGPCGAGATCTSTASGVLHVQSGPAGS